jgi:cyclophilin family peptidyl-prolyl cis-trans isomerase
MALLDLMPNAVYTFLEMVDQGLWDGCSLVMKATHVLKAIPLPYDQSQDPNITANIFVDKNLNGPIFKEYSHTFPHTPYTLGFTGVDISSFYINTEDIADIHAGDSTFGKVVDGFGTLECVDAARKENGIWLRDRIGIKSTKIIVL